MAKYRTFTPEFKTQMATLLYRIISLSLLLFTLAACSPAGSRAPDKAYVSKYGYSLTYPSDWTVSTEYPGTIGAAQNVERVTFEQPNYGKPDQISSIMIQAGQGGYAVEGQCQGSTEVIPGIQGCRRSYPRAITAPGEVVWFRPPPAATDTPFFVVQFVYNEPEQLEMFNRMLASFRYN